MKKLLQAFVLLWLLTSVSNSICAPTAQPIPVLALVSYEIAPQQQFLKGFQSFFAQNNVNLELKVENIDTLSGAKHPPALIVALGSAATQYAIDTYRQTPICASLLVEDSLVRNHSNVTGVSLSFPIATHLQWLNRFIPHGRAIGVLYNPNKNTADLEILKAEAAKLDIPLITTAVNPANGLDNVLKRLPNQVAALWSFDDAAIFTPQNAETLLLFSFRNRIPLIGLSTQWVKAGALYALDRDYFDLGRQCAEQAWRILQGTPVQRIPLETPRKILYSVNQQTAEHMKLELPDTLLRGAYETFP
ncbi:MAG: ABC transporter substrate-binding protein [Gammaproteobacteria bacterium]